MEPLVVVTTSEKLGAVITAISDRAHGRRATLVMYEKHIEINLDMPTLAAWGQAAAAIRIADPQAVIKPLEFERLN